MAKDNIKSKKGFTIIEVVLVLAIAGLIFLMVFIALPALQRSQRDTQRRDDMGRFIAQLAQYQANNNNQVPGKPGTLNDWNNFITNYLRVGGDTFQDPDGTNYSVASVCVLTNNTTCANTSLGTKIKPDAALTWDANKNQIMVYTNARCDGEKAVYVANSPNQIAVRYKLEGAGIYCGNN